jgi:foldase protein PrsA
LLTRHIAFAAFMLALAGCSSSQPTAPPPDRAKEQQRDDLVAEERTKRVAVEAKLEDAVRERDRLKRELEASRETASANDTAARAAQQLLLDQQKRIKELQLRAGTADQPGTPPVARTNDAAPTLSSLARRRPIDLRSTIALVDGEPVSRLELVEALYRTYAAQYWPSYVSVVVVEREAKRLGIDVTELECDQLAEQKLAELSAQQGGDDKFAAQLEKQGFTMAEARAVYRAQTRTALLIERLVRYERGTPAGKDAFEKRVRDSYEKTFGEKVQARHIYVKVMPGSPEEEWKLAEKRATALHSRLKAGEEFEKLARAESDDQASKSRGGDLGLFGKSQFAQLPELNKLLFEMPVGFVSGPIRSAAGFHIVQITKKEPAEKRFDDVREKIAKGIETEGVTQEENDALLNRLKSTAKIEKKLEFTE